EDGIRDFHVTGVQTCALPIYAIDFKGTALMHPLIMEEKEWTLDGIQNGFIVLKCVGEHTPIQEGVQVRRISDGQNTYFSREHIQIGRASSRERKGSTQAARE